MTHPVKITYNSDSNNIGLPKWPAFVVVGENVSPELAAEIIIRTDYSIPDFQFASNDRSFEQELNNIFSFPWEVDTSLKGHNAHWATTQKLHKDLKLIKTNYLNNSRLLSSYVGGPHGWINWTGDVFSNTTNLGKWPEVTEVADDWSLIAQAFPTLNLKCHLYNGESCEYTSRPVVEFIIKDGNVEVNRLNDDAKPLTTLVDNTQFNMLSLFRPNRERGITIPDLMKKLTTLYNGRIPQYGGNNK